MTVEQNTIQAEINRLLAEQSEAAFKGVTAIISDSEIKKIIKDTEPFPQLFMAISAYRQAAASEKAAFFSGISSLEDVAAKVNNIRFLLWNIEFDTDSSKAKAEINGMLDEGSISHGELAFFLKNYSFDSDKVSRKLFHE